MANRNVDKGREAENAVAAVLREHGMLHAERRAKRGGTHTMTCTDCDGTGLMDAGHGGGVPAEYVSCQPCEGSGSVTVPADAGDLTGIPGLAVQVKWSGYKPLATDMRRTDEQRRVAGADIGLLVRKRPGFGCARAGDWDAYLPTSQVAALLVAAAGHGPDITLPLLSGTWHTDLQTVARLLTAAGYGARQEAHA